VTDMLDEEDMLLSGDDYVVLLDNCSKDRSILIPEDDYSNVLPFLETILEEDEIIEEEDDVVDLNLLYNSDLRDDGDDVDSPIIINQIDTVDEVKPGEVVVVESEDSSSELVKNEFASVQRNDDSLNSCSKEAERTGGQFFVDKNTGILFKLGQSRGEPRNVLVLPKCKRDHVLMLSHDDMSHYGVKKTRKMIARNFFWPGWRTEVEAYVKSCRECQQKRRVTVADKIPIKPFVDRPTSSFEVIALDVYGPINPPSSQGHKYVLGIICLQSRWVDCYPMKSLKPVEMLENLMKFFAYAGYPKVIISDNGTNFVAKINKLLYEKFGIELRTSVPFHSEGNSTIERFCGTFRSMLTHPVNSENPRNWHMA